jgi:hypothetical protein
MRFYIHSDTPLEEIADFINNVAPKQVASDDEVPDHPGKDRRHDEIHDTSKRVVDPGDRHSGA